eukprot:TRINITY_DN18842_c0_g1_i2.p1 TRINITY_DN18842_c0_g1~~TRINITY_DN18842_c0_g1_i2.p1  ORF type:complete len:225 (+),score=36.41 TRINITY_DN18842_c0_g1_i2:102-677(+)
MLIHNSQLKQLYTGVDDIKLSCTTAIRGILNDISLLRAKHRSEVTLLISSNEKNAAAVINKLQQEREVVRRQAEQLENLYLELDRARHDQRNIQASSDVRFDAYNSSALRSFEGYKQLKVNSQKSINELQEEVKRLQIELRNRNEIMKDTGHSTIHKETFFPFARELELSLIHICRCRRYAVCRSRWSPYH